MNIYAVSPLITGNILSIGGNAALNGNDVNNMAKRYKEEMMRLYRKSSTAQSGAAAQKSTSGSTTRTVMATQTVQQSHTSGIMGMGAGMSGSAVTAPLSSSAVDRMDIQAQDMAQSMAMPQSSANAVHNCGSAARDMAGTAVPNIPGASYYVPDGSQTGMNVVGNGMQNTMQTMPMPVPVNCQCRFPAAGSIMEGMGVMRSGSGYTEQQAADTVTGQADSGIALANSDSAQDTILRSIIINAFPENGEYSVSDSDMETREIFPDFALPADVPADEDGVPSTARFIPSFGWISLTGDGAWGFLQVQVFNENDAPIQGALVTVRKSVSGLLGLTRLLYTNYNGLTSTIALPAPVLMTPTAQTTTPFSEYTISVRANGYYTIRNIKVPIYAGSKLLQPIEMRMIYDSPSQIQPRSGESIG